MLLLLLLKRLNGHAHSAELNEAFFLKKSSVPHTRV